MRRRIACGLAAVLALVLVVRLGLLALAPLPAALSRGRGEHALEDVRRALLREAPGEDGLRAEWVALTEIPLLARAAVVQAEDHRLFAHPGVDPRGLARALWLDLRAGEVVAGGSTLAMQLARLVYGLPRSAQGKLAQLPRALVLQARLGAEGVLEAYLNLAPFGRDVRGIAQASRVYFGRPLRDLTRAEAVLLACLPHAPSAYDPYRHPERLAARRRAVLGLMERRGLLSKDARAALSNEPLRLVPFARPFRAPHALPLAEREASRRGAPHAARLRTTLDPRLQSAAEWACARAIEELGGRAATGCAAVVMRVSSAEVLALVGSPDFHAETAGQVNAAVAPRQPGSALKPFVYALAFEQGKSPGSRIVDEPTPFAAQLGEYVPENYDRRFHGEITLRRALACSYNVPAAKLAAELGPARVLARLHKLGLSTLDAEADHYGVGIALGVGEVTLLDLVSAYATLARAGEYLAPTLLAGVDDRDGRPVALAERRRERVFSPGVSYLVGHVLADRAARRPAFGERSVIELPFDVAVKTGTSSSYRDNWTLGYAGDVAVGVWVGRHDGAPLLGVSGVSGAGPAFRHLMLSAVGRELPRFPPAPPEVVLADVGGVRDLTLAR